MKDQTIKKVRDLTKTQQRVTVLCACGHWTSIPETVIRMMSLGEIEDLREGQSFPCAHCPDPTPQDVREAKSASQLWREAGQP